jgi:hypothetical protein
MQHGPAAQSVDPDPWRACSPRFNQKQAGVTAAVYGTVWSVMKFTRIAG